MFAVEKSLSVVGVGKLPLRPVSAAPIIASVRLPARLGHLQDAQLYAGPQQRAKNLSNSVHCFLFLFCCWLGTGVMTDIFFFCLESFTQFHLLLSPRMRVGGEKESP